MADSWESKYQSYKERKASHRWPLSNIFEILLCDYSLEDIVKVAKNCNDGNGVDYTLSIIYDKLGVYLNSENVYTLARIIKDKSLVAITDPSDADIDSIKDKPHNKLSTVFYMISLKDRSFATLEMSWNDSNDGSCTAAAYASDATNAVCDTSNFRDVVTDLQIRADMYLHGHWNDYNSKLSSDTMEIISHIPTSNLSSATMEAAMEAVLLPALEADDFQFGGLKDIDKNLNEATKASPTSGSAPRPAAPSPSGGNNGIENLNDATANQMNQDGLNDPSASPDANTDSNDGGGDPGADNQTGNGTEPNGDDLAADANSMANNPDEDQPDQGSDFDDDDEDDDGTDNKRIIRKNFFKLYQIIKDTLRSMEMFTPEYTSPVSKYYLRIQHSLTETQSSIYDVLANTINDLTVEELMKKYTIANNIYDISARMLKQFFKEYNESMPKKNQTVDKFKLSPDKNGQQNV